MWHSILSKTNRRIRAIDNFINVMDLRDNVLSNTDDPFHARVSSTVAGEHTIADDRVFRHCAVMTYLYAVYENFVEQALSLWSTRLPRYRRFNDLNPKIQRLYRERIAALLSAIERREYQSVDLQQVLRAYANALDSHPNWIMVPEAVLFRDPNLRRSEIVKLYQFAELSDVWSIVEKDKALKTCLQTVENDESLENAVDNFVHFRNEAAHGNPDEILGIDSLRAWTCFVEAFCDALAKPLAAKNIDEERALGRCGPIGHVYKSYSGGVVLAAFHDCDLRVAQRLYARKGRNAYPLHVESIQRDNEPQEQISADSTGLNLGLKCSRSISEGTELFLESSVE